MPCDMNIVKTLNSFVWTYTYISKLGHDDLYNSQQLVSIIGHIDLISPQLKIPTYLLHLVPKNTPIHGNCIPSPPTFMMRVDGNFHAFPWYGGYLENICTGYPPKYSIYGQPKVKADSWLRWKAKADPLIWSEGQGHIHIWKKLDILKDQDGHLTLLVCLPIALSLMEQHQICDSPFDKPYISILIQFKIRKTSGFRVKQCLLWAQGKQFYFLLRLASTPYCP